jgi:hypothetical protein
MDSMSLDLSQKILYTWQVVGVGAGYIGTTTGCAAWGSAIPARPPPRLRLEAWGFYHLAKFLDHFFLIRLLLEAWILRLESSPEDLPFTLIIGPKDLHCLERIRSSAWRDFSCPWDAFLISKLILIMFFSLSFHCGKLVACRLGLYPGPVGVKLKSGWLALYNFSVSWPQVLLPVCKLYRTQIIEPGLKGGGALSLPPELWQWAMLCPLTWLFLSPPRSFI